MKERPDKALAELLKSYGIPWAKFAARRPQSYEQALAAASLKSLEQFYSVLLQPGKSYEELRKLCPPWPEGTAYAGQFPTYRICKGVAERMRMESTLEDLGSVAEFVEKVRKRVTKLGMGKHKEMLDIILTMLGEEMIRAKLGGVPVSEQLPPLDRLLAHKKIGVEEAALAMKRKKYKDDQAARKAQEQAALEGAKPGVITKEVIAEIQEAAKLL